MFHTHAWFVAFYGTRQMGIFQSRFSEIVCLIFLILLKVLIKYQKQTKFKKYQRKVFQNQIPIWKLNLKDKLKLLAGLGNLCKFACSTWISEILKLTDFFIIEIYHSQQEALLHSQLTALEQSFFQYYSKGIFRMWNTVYCTKGKMTL